MSRIILSDGTEYKNLEESGNTFIADYELNAGMFPEGKLHGVKIVHEYSYLREDGKTDEWSSEEFFEHMKLIVAGPRAQGGWRVVLAEMTREELKAIETDGKIEYLAMMTGVEL